MHLLVLSLLQRCATLKKERRGWRFLLPIPLALPSYPRRWLQFWRLRTNQPRNCSLTLVALFCEENLRMRTFFRTVFGWKLKLKTERLYEDLVPIDRRLDDAFYKINPWTEHWDLSTQIYQIAIYPLDSVIPSFFFFLTYGFPIHRTPCFSLP